MKMRKALVSCGLAILVAFAPSSPALAIIVDKSLNVPNVKQEQTYWCWAGSSLSILNYYLTYTSQCVFVAYVKTGSTSGSCANQTATDTEAQRGLNYFGVSSTYTQSALSWNSVTTEISNSRPIYAGISWLNQYNQIVGGHAVVIDGYYNDTNLGETDVKYMDPGDGTHHIMDYAAFTYTSQSRQWDGTLYNTAKKP